MLPNVTYRNKCRMIDSSVGAPNSLGVHGILMFPYFHRHSAVVRSATGGVVRIHGADLYRYCAVHHSDSLKNAITCKWSFFVRSFNVNGTLVTNGKWFHRCVTTWQSLFSRSISSVLPRAFVEGFPMECDRF